MTRCKSVVQRPLYWFFAKQALGDVLYENQENTHRC